MYSPSCFVSWIDVVLPCEGFYCFEESVGSWIDHLFAACNHVFPYAYLYVFDSFFCLLILVTAIHYELPLTIIKNTLHNPLTNQTNTSNPNKLTYQAFFRSGSLTSSPSFFELGILCIESFSIELVMISSRSIGNLRSGSKEEKSKYLSPRFLRTSRTN